jgi:hypothetical protein
MTPFIRLYNIFYDESQIEKCDYIPFRNKHTEKLWRFENNPMIEIVDNELTHIPDYAFVGIFSWNFREKTRISKTKLYTTIDNSAELWNCSPDLGSNICGKWTFMEWSEEGHKGITRLIQTCCDHVGINYNPNPEHIIYANQFVAMHDIYRDYINNVIKPCLELLEGELWKEVNRPAGYTRGLPKDELLQRTGLEFYNYLPFVLERMVMQYVDHFKIKTKRV